MNSGCRNLEKTIYELLKEQREKASPERKAQRIQRLMLANFAEQMPQSLRVRICLKQEFS